MTGAGASAQIDLPQGRMTYESPYQVLNEEARTGLVLVGDHASNALPPDYDTLGLGPAAFTRHIAYDIGIGALLRLLAEALGAVTVLAGFSRLLIDSNRGADDPTLVMKLSDGDLIPGNRNVDDAEVARRTERFHRPYHRAIDKALDSQIGAGHKPLLISLHSFTPAWRGQVRPWQCGVLWDRDAQTAEILLEGLRSGGDLTVGDNEPYSGRLEGDCMFFHGTMRGISHGLIEIRQDLISDEAGIAAWAERLAPILKVAQDQICE